MLIPDMVGKKMKKIYQTEGHDIDWKDPLSTHYSEWKETCNNVLYPCKISELQEASGVGKKKRHTKVQN